MSTVTPSNDAPTGEISNDLVAEVVLNLKPVIASTVQSTLSTGSSSSSVGQVSDQTLVKEIVRKLQPEIRAVISRTVGQKNYSQVTIHRKKVQ